ncbi:arylsulfatase [Lewinella sp. IMCC34183]|uniref:arylsulfatase n=1 Tax=Lewinella sp. IMCC34183 TaxID=2248762 RepID=UPI000E24882E|nr:arylsulfatase [Lewinella sp. IMCC34183]
MPTPTDPLLACLLLLYLACGSPETPGPTEDAPARPPNVVYILVDDLGYGDLSSYGQRRFTTPNIDRLAERGIRFTQHYAGSTVCAPSRASLMTGLHTGHTPIRGNKEVQPEGQWPIPDSIRTLAELMAEAGYATGAFGKWGLGYPGSEGAPGRQGFGEFYGYNCQRLAHNYYPYYLREDQQRDSLPGNAGTGTATFAPTRIHERALAFIERHRDRPFFLFYPNVMPHAELAAPDSLVTHFAEQFGPEEAWQGRDSGPGYKDGAYGSVARPHATFAAMVSLIDQQVGEIVDKLDDLGLTENTLVIFTSDNGPHVEGGADPDFFLSNGPFRGYKRDLYEGGIRVPMIASWPGTVPQGRTSDHISAFWDVYPTLAELTGQPVDKNLDGISFLPVLEGRPAEQRQHGHLYWEFHERGGRVAVREGRWKGVRYGVLEDPAAALELYDLQTDPGEQHDLAGQHPAVVARLDSLIRVSHSESSVFPFVAR